MTHIKSRSILDVRKGLTKFFKIYGTPKQIVCDNEPSLRSVEVRGLLHDLNIDIYFTPPNHSETNGTVERFHSTIAEIFRCIKPSYEDLTTKEIFYIDCTQYNNTIHSAIKMKQREAFNDDQERPLDMELMVQNRNKVYDDIILAHDKSKKQNLNDYNKVQGIKKKNKPNYLPIIAVENKGRILVDDSGREIHKENLKGI